MVEACKKKKRKTVQHMHFITVSYFVIYIPVSCIILHHNHVHVSRI